MKTTKRFLFAAWALLCGTALADNLYWAGGQTGYWDDPGTWTNAAGVAMVPTTADQVFIQAPGGATVILTGSVELTSFGLQFAINDDTEGTLIIEPGATLKTKGAQLSQGVRSFGTIIQNGGTYTLNANISFGRSTGNRVGRYYMNSGELTFTRNGIFLGYAGGTGYFYQKGGTVTSPVVSIPNKASSAGSVAYYEISGGSLTVSDTLNIGNTPGPTKGGSMSSEFRVIGSAPTIAVTGTLVMYAPANVLATLTALIDNGGVSPINLNASSAAVTLAGEFAAGVAHGVAFTATNTFDVIAKAPSFAGSFTTLPDTDLWTTSTVADDGKYTFRMSLADPSCKKVFQGMNSFEVGAFSPAAAGHVTIRSQSVGQPLPVYLAVNPGSKTVADLIGLLAEAGFNAAASDETGYDVMFTVTPTVAESHLVWDLSGFDAGAAVSAIVVKNPQQPLCIMLL